MNRKIDNENRHFKSNWESDYLFWNNKNKPQCLVCLTVLSVNKEYNICRHYKSNHEAKFKEYKGEARNALIADFKKKTQSQINCLNHLTTVQTSSNLASFFISYEIAKEKKPLTDGEYIKKCAIKLAQVFKHDKFVKDLGTIPLSRQTVKRRIGDINEHLEITLKDIMSKCSFFSIALDSSKDITDVSQLLVHARIINKDFIVNEELLELCTLNGTSRGIDIFEEIKKVIEKYGGFEKMSAVITDGAASMVGKTNGLLGLLNQNNIDVPAFHCIIHQEALCGKRLKLKNVMDTVMKIVNLIRGGNRALSHRKFISFLEEMDSNYSDLLLYTEVRWLSRGMCLQRFFVLRNEVRLFLSEHVKIDTIEFEKELQDPTFLSSLAFLTDITLYLNKLNLLLQGKNQSVLELLGYVDGFKKKLHLLKSCLEQNNLTHFPCCEIISNEIHVTFSSFTSHIDVLISEFDSRFLDLEIIRPQLPLFKNPLSCDIESQPAEIQMELCDLQTDPFLNTCNKQGIEFWKLVSKEHFPKLRDWALKIFSMFGSTYICEATFSSLNHIKSKKRNRLNDETLSHLLRIPSSNLEINFESLTKQYEHPQCSH